MKTRYIPERLTETYGPVTVEGNTKQVIAHYKLDGKAEAQIYIGTQAKPFTWYRFKDSEACMKYILETINNILVNMTSEVERKAKQKELNANFDASDYIKIGDVVYTSWGYDQTNVDFYQVIGITRRAIKLVSIGSKVVGNSDGFSSMSNHIVAVPDPEANDKAPELTLRVNFDGKGVQLRGGDSFKYFSLWDGKPKYQSWYA